MANSKSASKRARQTATRSLRNRRVLTRVRGLHRRITGTGSHEADAASLISAIDKAAKRGMIHRNAANRRKAKLARARAAAKQ